MSSHVTLSRPFQSLDGTDCRCLSARSRICVDSGEIIAPRVDENCVSYTTRKFPEFSTRCGNNIHSRGFSPITDSRCSTAREILPMDADRTGKVPGNVLTTTGGGRPSLASSAPRCNVVAVNLPRLSPSPGCRPARGSGAGGRRRCRTCSCGGIPARPCSAPAWSKPAAAGSVLADDAGTAAFTRQALFDGEGCSAYGLHAQPPTTSPQNNTPNTPRGLA